MLCRPWLELGGMGKGEAGGACLWQRGAHPWPGQWDQVRPGSDWFVPRGGRRLPALFLPPVSPDPSL